ncbi:hypothetical protein PMZ80_006403 [Knufia obscura]|uniref:Uncharacterized protein n=2 Tax=Knufia TaxID=430999 RepID=A0AAN8I8W0_9EURO|nr:hypothetical protein PMZ80_006403 [Knufia obscura]KAK5953450.1 hypothetical protein OHC33_005394 [Knufia fluminis]
MTFLNNFEKKQQDAEAERAKRFEQQFRELEDRTDSKLESIKKVFSAEVTTSLHLVNFGVANEFVKASQAGQLNTGTQPDRKVDNVQVPQCAPKADTDGLHEKLTAVMDKLDLSDTVNTARYNAIAQQLIPGQSGSDITVGQAVSAQANLSDTLWRLDIAQGAFRERLANFERTLAAQGENQASLNEKLENVQEMCRQLNQTLASVPATVTSAEQAQSLSQQLTERVELRSDAAQEAFRKCEREVKDLSSQFESTKADIESYQRDVAHNHRILKSEMAHNERRIFNKLADTENLMDGAMKYMKASWSSGVGNLSRSSQSLFGGVMPPPIISHADEPHPRKKATLSEAKHKASTTTVANTAHSSLTTTTPGPITPRLKPALNPKSLRFIVSATFNTTSVLGFPSPTIMALPASYAAKVDNIIKSAEINWKNALKAQN